MDYNVTNNVKSFLMNFQEIENINRTYYFKYDTQTKTYTLTNRATKQPIIDAKEANKAKIGILMSYLIRDGLSISALGACSIREDFFNSQDYNKRAEQMLNSIHFDLKDIVLNQQYSCNTSFSGVYSKPINYFFSQYISNNPSYLKDCYSSLLNYIAKENGLQLDDYEISTSAGGLTTNFTCSYHLLSQQSPQTSQNTNIPSQPQGNQRQPQAPVSRPAMPPTPQPQSGNQGQQSQSGKGQSQGTQQNPQGNQNTQGAQAQASVSGAYANLDGKIDFLNSLVLVPKTKSDFAQELNGKSGITREDLSCCYAVVNNTKRNVSDLTYKAIEKTLFEIVNIPDFNEAKRLAVKYGQVLQKANYSSSFGTAARSLLERDKISASNLDKKSVRIELLRDFGAYGDSIASSEIICKYIKMSNNDVSPMTNKEKSKVLLKMQDNYDKFAFEPKPKTPQNFEKLIDTSKFPKADNINLVQKTDQEIQQEESLYRSYHNYFSKACPLTIADGNGGKQDIWNLGANDIINKLTVAIVSGDNNEIRKMRIICENMKDHFRPTYGEMAKLTKVINDYWQMSKNPDVDKALDALKGMAMDKYKEAYTIAQFNAQNNGKPQASYSDMVDVFKELQKQNDLLKQNQSQGMTI